MKIKLAKWQIVAEMVAAVIFCEVFFSVGGL